jgi:hypothetical protein
LWLTQSPEESHGDNDAKNTVASRRVRSNDAGSDEFIVHRGVVHEVKARRGASEQEHAIVDAVDGAAQEAVVAEALHMRGDVVGELDEGNADVVVDAVCDVDEEAAPGVLALMPRDGDPAPPRGSRGQTVRARR